MHFFFFFFYSSFVIWSREHFLQWHDNRSHPVVFQWCAFILFYFYLFYFAWSVESEIYLPSAPLAKIKYWQLSQSYAIDNSTLCIISYSHSHVYDPTFILEGRGDGGGVTSKMAASFQWCLWWKKMIVFLTLTKWFVKLNHNHSTVTT